ncbi:universal stress protein [Halorhodospira abdelmalekii]|uniref:universal stress protein n=1 Tax=Halorhodospira abdelmalekii TaxID=421629 RepID=UPI001906E9AF|nr:universal stress protein [Halorhodospira abdelmalekii]
MDKILLATDLSVRADRATQRAVVLAQAQQSELRAVHIIEADLEEVQLQRLFRDGPGVEQIATELIENTQESVAARIEHALAGRSLADYSVFCTVGRGHPEIAAEAQAWGADLVVIGAHGHHGMRDFLLGTTAENLVHALEQTVLVVKSSQVEPYQRVLVPLDFSDRAQHALEHAVQLAPNADLEVVHVFDSMPFERLYSASSAGSRLREVVELGGRESQQALERWLARLEVAAPQLAERISAQHVRSGYPPAEIVATSLERSADLIVLGTRGLSHWYGAVVGSVARRVLQQAECDVALERGVAAAS